MRELDKRKIKLEPFAEEEPSIPDDFNLEEALIEKVQTQKVKAAMESLPEAQRTVLLLWVVGERKYDEMAQELGLSMPALKSLLHRAKQSLVKALGGKNE